ncbi:MAG: hypothetical protein PVJ95_09300, partial [Cellvibrionales bacterium]
SDLSDRACSRLENLEHFPGLIPDDTPFRDAIQELSDYRFNKHRLLCGEDKPASCATSTPDGHPVFIDQHHLTREFAVWVGSLLAETPPAWLARIAPAPSEENDRP